MGQQLRGRYLHWAVTGELAPSFEKTWFTMLIDTAASCQAFLLLGYDQGVMSGLIGANNQFGKQFNHPNANMQGISLSTPPLFCMSRDPANPTNPNQSLRSMILDVPSAAFLASSLAIDLVGRR